MIKFIRMVTSVSLDKAQACDMQHCLQRVSYHSHLVPCACNITLRIHMAAHGIILHADYSLEQQHHAKTSSYD